MTCDGLGSNPGRGVSFQFGWTNGRYPVRLISRTGTESPPLGLCPLNSSLICDRCSLLKLPENEVTTLRRDRNVHVIIIIKHNILDRLYIITSICELCHVHFTARAATLARY